MMQFMYHFSFPLFFTFLAFSFHKFLITQMYHALLDERKTVSLRLHVCFSVNAVSTFFIYQQPC